MKAFFGCIAIATEAKNGNIKMQNAKFVGKRKSLNHFLFYLAKIMLIFSIQFTPV